MLHYILQVTAFQVFFLLVYDLFLKRETFFNWNRFYLLGTATLSLILPFIKLNAIKALTPKDFVINLPEVVIGKITPTVYQAEVADLAGITLAQPQTPLWQTLLWVGVIIAALIFVFKIIKLYLLRFKNPRRWRDNVLVVNLLNSKLAFSFFNNIFIGDKIGKEEQPMVLKHELVHVKEMHTIDLLFFETLKILMWFNPLVYMYQNRIKTLHEYIADAKAVKQNNKVEYYQSLLNQVFETNNLSFTNTFFNKTLIKKRIAMLQKSKSKQIKLLKYALLIPVIFGMLFYVSCTKEIGNNPENEVIDINELSYSIPLLSEEPIELSFEIQSKKDAYEAFLETNYSEYVSWAEVNKDQNNITFSIHPIGEKLPENVAEIAVNSFKKEKGMKTYMRLFWDEGNLKNAQKNSGEAYDDNIEVPFSVIENVPVFPGCEGVATEKDRKKCMSESIAKLINKKFNTELAANLGLTGRQVIRCAFKIDKEGNIVEILARAPHEGLAEEAERVLNLLPKMQPGKQKGKTVTVPYALPIVFQIQE
ncbi:M56 family metallopeptidase [Winogradskyella immobilis]|uniref:Energy transducer TonB n=1 Tax=Winogradskyella immobilis TaxID=2816852 RepID=A0ABS8EIQ4_9FLAO|nr:M56 family metallopeptidase [Winogradskyella immobilis]MCC1483074.1 energy transducer TonB [Winogradskyella immobilis]MCG0015169.1 M56 family metallopeptidase [Winogradskyella immobilis]